jgi:hypothetical protein
MENQSLTESTNSLKISFPVVNGKDVGIGEVSYKPKDQVIKNKDVLKGVIYLIESSGASYNDIAIWAFKKVCQKNDVTCQELIDAYWKAYSDPYVGKEGIQWRHLWKHIEKERLGSGDKIYTYKEMLFVCDKEHITTDHFEFIDVEKWKRK